MLLFMNLIVSEDVDSTIYFIQYNDVLCLILHKKNTEKGIGNEEIEKN